MVERIQCGKYDVIILNFANCDMVGHTGVFERGGKAAVEAVDTCVGKVADAITEMDGVAADYRRPRQRRQDGRLRTAHPSPPTPPTRCPSAWWAIACKLREGGRLADIAPTMLKILNVPQPKEMTGESIIQG